MTSNQKWYVLIAVLIGVGLLLLINLEKKLLLTIIVEPSATAEINWLAEDGLWFGGTFEDSDDNGKIEVKLPQNITRITLGREFREKINVTVITSATNQELADDILALCPVVITQDANELLNICSLPTDNQDNDVSSVEVTIIDGKSSNMPGLSSKDATIFFEESSARLASIEVLDSNAIQNLKEYTGEGDIIGYDELTFKWNIFSR